MYPPKKYTDRNIQCLREYLELLEIFDDHNDFVFASEKPMSETDIYGRVRRDIFTEANVNPRYNVLIAVTTKRKVEQNVEAVVLDTVGDSIFFQSFVLHLMQIKFLVPGDILVVNNCSIHKKGRKEYIVETLWECGILIVPLPPFTPELNPTELAFDEMTARIKASRSRSILALVDFAEVVKEEFDNMSRRDVKKFYRRCDYDI
jgi:transposase